MPPGLIDRWLPTLGLYSAFLACRAIVFKSKRQSRLTVATMFLERRDEPNRARTSRHEQYILQGGCQTTSTRRGRGRSRSRGSHPSTINGLRAWLMTTVHYGSQTVHAIVGRCQLAVAGGERQRTGSSEGFGLRSVRGMSLNGFHFDVQLRYQQIVRSLQRVCEQDTMLDIVCFVNSRLSDTKMQKVQDQKWWRD